jgi:hypothetical protein
MRRWGAPLLVVAVVAAVLVFVGPGSAQAGPPKTLAERVRADGRPVDPDFPIDFVGVTWTGGPSDAADGAIRFRDDAGRWGPWTPLGEDGAEVEGRFASGLVAGGDADAYQVRLPGGVAGARSVAINTTDGPRRRANGPRPATAGADTAVISRAQWGADESLRFDSTGKETFPPVYYAAQKLTVHHTDTANGDPDPAATVRAIYRYHAIDRGFGDIGYHYLVAEDGRVFEGRWSGTDGDPAHDTAGNVVTAAHVSGWNSGNVGIALLGTLTTQGPTTAARSSLESLLADLAGRHRIDPQASGTYTHPVNGATWTGPNVPGHRDFAATECPGGALYAQLPSIRSAVAARLAGLSTTSSSSTSTSSTTSSSTTTSSSSTTTSSTTTTPTRTKTTPKPRK